ncbi:MAG: metalloprotease [Schumannella sp.]|nr:metalloprotease [Schumannella sp.]
METVLLFVLGIVIILVGLALSIGLHEIGHLVPAKKFGVKVGQYMIGFGPTIWKRKYGETEYGIKALPLGGYISMAGMFPPARKGGKPRTASTGFFDTLVQDARTSSADQIKEGDEDRVFYKLAIWKRIIIMLGGPTMNLIIATVLYAIVLCGFGFPQSSTTIGYVAECIVPVTSSQTTCSSSDQPGPAAGAGLKPGDEFLSIDGVAITSSDQIGQIIRASAGQKLTVVFQRDGAQQTAEVTPITNTIGVTNSLGQVVTDLGGNPVTQWVGYIGIGYVQVIAQRPVTAVLPAVGDNIVSVGKIIITLPNRLVQTAQAAFGGQDRDPNGPISVVGIGRIAGEIAAYDKLSIGYRVASLLQILAGLNVALFVFNLVPLLPLDGGHVAGALWEGLRRRIAKLFKRPDPGPVDTAKLVPITLAVSLLLGAMSLLLIYADIVNPISIF